MNMKAKEIEDEIIALWRTGKAVYIESGNHKITCCSVKEIFYGYIVFHRTDNEEIEDETGGFGDIENFYNMESAAHYAVYFLSGNADAGKTWHRDDAEIEIELLEALED